MIAIGLFEVAAAVHELLFGAASGVVIAGHDIPRVAGTLEGPNQFAAWLNLLLPVLFARMLTDRNPWLIPAVALGGRYGGGDALALGDRGRASLAQRWC